MIQGIVNQRGEATLPLVISGSSGQKAVINAVIDTGFDGFLSLPSEMIFRLELPWTISNPATLGDGSTVVFDFYAGQVIWDGQYRMIDIAASDTEPLIGTAMLHGYSSRIEHIQGGIVRINRLASSADDADLVN
jgi:clan AA aspartic protease